MEAEKQISDMADKQALHKRLAEDFSQNGAKRIKLEEAHTSSANKGLASGGCRNEVAVMKPPNPKMHLNYKFSVSLWNSWVTKKNREFAQAVPPVPQIKELLNLHPHELNGLLVMFIAEIENHKEQPYTPDMIYYLCLGIQTYLNLNKKCCSLFSDTCFASFRDHLDEIVKVFPHLYDNSAHFDMYLKEEHLWESRQLGTHSPHSVLNTLIYFNMKFFNLQTVADHSSVAFIYVITPDKRPNIQGIKYWPSQCAYQGKRESCRLPASNNPQRCPMTIFNFYLSKCPKGAENSVYYLQPELHYTADSPFWFSKSLYPLSDISKTLNAFRMVDKICFLWKPA